MLISIVQDSGTWYTDEHLLRIDRRRDEVINVSAHRLSTASMERAIVDGHPSVMEAVVVPMEDKIKGQVRN